MINPTDTLHRLQAVLSTTGEDSSDFDLNADNPAASELRPAAVLLPLIVENGNLELILTRRADHLKHHPGQVALPGGKMEHFDKDLDETALREANEEIGLPATDVRLLGRLPNHRTVSNFAMTPVVGLVGKPFTIIPDPSEVAEVFKVPFSHVLDPANYRIEGREWLGQQRYFFTVPHGPYYIWGATARILRGLADRMQP